MYIQFRKKMFEEYFSMKIFSKRIREKVVKNLSSENIFEKYCQNKTIFFDFFVIKDNSSISKNVFSNKYQNFFRIIYFKRKILFFNYFQEKDYSKKTFVSRKKIFFEHKSFLKSSLKTKLEIEMFETDFRKAYIL